MRVSDTVCETQPGCRHMPLIMSLGGRGRGIQLEASQRNVLRVCFKSIQTKTNLCNKTNRQTKGEVICFQSRLEGTTIFLAEVKFFYFNEPWSIRFLIFNLLSLLCQNSFLNQRLQRQCAFLQQFCALGVIFRLVFSQNLYSWHSKG